MEPIKNKTEIIVLVVLNLLSLIALVVFFEFRSTSFFNHWWIIANILALLVCIITFFPAFYKTGLFRFTHMSLKKMDERELQLSSWALRYSYSIFAIVSILVLYVFIFADLRIDAVIAAALIYFANVLPGSVLIIGSKA